MKNLVDYKNSVDLVRDLNNHLSSVGLCKFTGTRSSILRLYNLSNYKNVKKGNSNYIKKAIKFNIPPFSSPFYGIKNILISQMSLVSGGREGMLRDSSMHKINIGDDVFSIVFKPQTGYAFIISKK